MNDLKGYYFEKYSPNFQYDLLYTQFFIICDNLKNYENKFVSENKILCKIYCEYEIIQKMFKYDYNAIIKIWCMSGIFSSSAVYRISDLINITKKKDNKEYCEFTYTINPSILDKMCPIEKKLHISIYTKSANIFMPICEKLGFIICPKLYKNTKSIDVLSNMRRLYNDISDEQISIDDRKIVLKMISAYESYMSGNIPHKKFTKIVELYECKDQDNLIKTLEKYDNYILNASVSCICSLYNNIKDESIKEHLYSIVSYITDNEDVAKYICNNPQIMILDNINYNIPHFYNSTKKILDVIINLDDGYKNNICEPIDCMNKLCSYVRYSYNK